MLAPVLVTAPTDLPVSIVEAKAWCRVDHDDDDDLLEALIAAATGHLDGWSGCLGRAIMTQTWRQDFGGFSRVLRLPMFPVSSVESVKYFDADNAEQTLQSANYTLMTDERGCFLEIDRDLSWPSTYCRRDAVSVTYLAGEGSAPAAIATAIKMLVANWYMHRESVGSAEMAADLPLGVRRILSPLNRTGV